MPKTHVIAIDDHPRTKARLEFDIDFETGMISDVQGQNTSADMWQRIIGHWRDNPVSLAEFDWQQSYPAPDPLHNPKSFAWKMMAEGWVLEGELTKYPAPIPDDVPEGSVA